MNATDVATASHARSMHWGLAKRLSVLTLIVAFLAPNLVKASESCGALEREELRLKQQMTELLTEYPGTHLVIGLCAAVGQKSYERTGSNEEAASTFGLCAVMGCAIAGFENCGTVATSWFGLALRHDAVKSRKRDLSCL